MTDALIITSIFLGISSIVAVPLGVLIGIPTFAWVARGYLRLKERELDLRRLEVAATIQQAHFERLPSYVDAADPEALIAWASADRELANLAVVRASLTQ